MFKTFFFLKRKSVPGTYLQMSENIQINDTKKFSFRTIGKQMSKLSKNSGWYL